MPLVCPDQTGAYQIFAMGAGCGDLTPAAPQCIITDGRCIDTLASPADPGGQGINGTEPIDTLGDFIDADLMLGSANYGMCNATWDPMAETLTIDCGGTQGCIVTLTRTSTTCPF